MICHYEGCFEKGEPSSRYARLWMMSKAKGGAYKRLSADRVAMYLGPIHAGVPSAANAQLVLPPLPGQVARTTYQGTFGTIASQHSHHPQHQTSFTLPLCSGDLLLTDFLVWCSADNVKYLDYGKPSGSGSIMFANGNMYTGPIMEGPGGSFMPVSPKQTCVNILSQSFSDADDAR